MRALSEARFIPYARRTGPENMAIDEYLIKWHIAAGRPAFRLYGWDPPALTLGRYQKAGSVNIDYCRGRGIPLVRRITGGGAIFHDAEVTYCLVCSIEDMEDRLDGNLPVSESYSRFNGFILDMYRGLGLDASFAGTAGAGRAPFCFSGREEFDIVVKGKKIGGNAQRRMHSIVLQHGSIPLSIDRDIMEKVFIGAPDHTSYSSLEEALGRGAAPEECASALKEAFAESMGTVLAEEPLSGEELRYISKLVIGKYAKDRWNLTGELHEDKETALAQ